METGYMVVAKDGQEYGPLDRDTIQRWYYEGRLDQNSRVYEPGKHKFRLKEIFDLTVWNNPALVTQAAAASNADPTFMPKTMSDLTGDVSQPTPGMFAAGILLVINGVMGLFSIALILLLKLNASGSPRSYVVPIVDFIVAAGLLRGNERFRKWGLARAVLGGAYFLVTFSAQAFTTSTTIMSWIEVVFQLIFCAGIAALLWGDWPSKLRVGVGIGAVLLAWSGIITTEAVTVIVQGVQEQRAFEKYAVEGAVFEDKKLGVCARLPEGWALLTDNNPIVSLPDAKMVVVHKNSGCLAALLVERDPVGSSSSDDYLTLLFQTRQSSTPTLKELGRTDVEFGGHQARQLDTSWATKGNKFRGFTAACKMGASYYSLNGWCIDQVYSRAFPAFQSLEKAFQIGFVAATEPPEITSQSEEDFYDLVFFIKEHKKLGDGSQSIIAYGLHSGQPVGFEVVLKSRWQQSVLSSDVPIPTFSGVVAYRSVGADSDLLLEALDQIYETKRSPKQMKNETRFAVVTLEGDPGNLEQGPVKMKLFFEAAAEDRYAELYTNIDLGALKLYVGEKDPEYRLAIVRALQAR
jgi:hypothetical protein